MKVTETDEIEVVKTRTSFAKTQETATARIDEYTRLAVDPHDVRGRGASVISDWAARAKDLQRHALGWWAMRRLLRVGRAEK